MARNENTAAEGAVAAEAGTRKRRASGPRQAQPKYLLVRVLDGSGNPVQGGTVEVITQTKNIDEFVSAQASNPGSTLMKIGGGNVAKTGE